MAFEDLIPDNATLNIVDDLRWAAEQLLRREVDGGYVEPSEDGYYHVVIAIEPDPKRPSGFHPYYVNVSPGLPDDALPPLHVGFGQQEQKRGR
jgi:hypothetical protein